MRLQEFQKGRGFLLCVDSDGCAMDTMDIKHFRCFGPCMVEEWGLGPWEAPILERWNQINLYTLTRGINRFRGLALALTEINERYTPVEGVQELDAWAQNAVELSNSALEQALKTAQGPCMAKALRWSQAVNRSIDALPKEGKVPFPGVREALEAAHPLVDVAVVSSANREAVEEEWARCGLLPWVDVVCCQDDGSKSACLAQLLQKGYAPGRILMVGDAPGDEAAARENGVYFYPILVGREREGWEALPKKALPRLMEGAYGPYGEERAACFYENLQGGSPV